MNVEAWWTWVPVHCLVGLGGGKMIWMEMAAPPEGCLAEESHRRGFEF